MSRQITKELAKSIVKKLDAQPIKSVSTKHDMFGVYHEGAIIATIGIRRGSEKDQGHDHVQSQIYVNTYFAKLLGQCPKKRADWIAELRNKGHIDDEKPPKE